MTEQPRGALTVRISAMPADTNANGDIFGGWVLSRMDQAGEMAHERAPGVMKRKRFGLLRVVLSDAFSREPQDSGFGLVARLTDDRESRLANVGQYHRADHRALSEGA